MDNIKVLIEISKDDYLKAQYGLLGSLGKVIANGTPEDDYSEIVKRPKGVKWSHSPYTTDLTCPICREVSKKSIFNNFCPSCGARMVEEEN